MQKYTWISRSMTFECKGCGKMVPLENILSNHLRMRCGSCGTEHILVSHLNEDGDAFWSTVYMTVERKNKYNWRKL